MVAGEKRRSSSNRKMWSGWPHLIILLVSFLIGVFAGIAFAFFVDPSVEFSDYLREYCVSLSLGELRVSFLAIVWDCVRWPLLTILLGITVLGLVGIPILFVIRGFLLSFSICTFGLLFGQRGIAIAAVLFGVWILFVLPAFFILGCNGICTACTHLPGALPFAGKQYRLETLLICGGIIAVSVAVQWTVTPAVLSVICSRLVF